MSNTASSAPRALVFAGPNGAGKSTHADAILAALGIETFVNADYIARGLSGHSSATQAMPVAARYAHQLTVTEAATWHKLQKLSQTV